jgi:flavodoxin
MLSRSRQEWIRKREWLVVFYSRTGTTKKVAETLSRLLKCDVEEIFDTRNRLGFSGYLRSGMDAAFKRVTVIKKTEKDVAAYYGLVVGTPIWASKVSPAVRTYVLQNKGHLTKVAFFCTCGGLGREKALREIADLSGQSPLALLEVSHEEVLNAHYVSKVEKFVDELGK